VGSGGGKEFLVVFVFCVGVFCGMVSQSMLEFRQAWVCCFFNTVVLDVRLSGGLKRLGEFFIDVPCQ